MASIAVNSLRVRDVMTSHAISVAPDDSVGEALGVIVEARVGCLPVIDESGRCVGVLSATDLLDLAQDRGTDIESMHEADGLTRELLVEHFERADFSDLSVQEVMTPTAVEILPDDTLQAAAGAMMKHAVHHLVVTEGRHRFAGLLSTMDIVRAVAEGGAGRLDA